MSRGLKVVVLATVLLAGCSSHNDDPTSNNQDSEQSIFGLWNLNPLLEGEDGIRAYVEITPDQLIYYIYQGNNATESQNCYSIESDEIESISDTTWVLSNGDGRETDLQATVDTLTISFVDTEDEDDDGDTSEVIVETFPRVVNISSVDLNSCS